MYHFLFFNNLPAYLFIQLFFADKQNCRKCAKVLQELENIDDEADQLGIGFVKIADDALAEEYNLGDLPKLVYYRHQIPIVYESKCHAVRVSKVYQLLILKHYC